MYCIAILTLSSMKMFVRNRQALFFSLFMPMLFLFIFGSMQFDRPRSLPIGVVTHQPSDATAAFVDRIKSIQAINVRTGTLDDMLRRLRDGDEVVVLDVPDDLIPPAGTASQPWRATAPAGTRPAPRAVPIYINEGRQSEVQAAITMLDQFAAQASLAAAHAQPLFTFEQQAKEAHNFRYIEFVLPGIIAMAVMQMSTFSVAFVFAQYKEKGILKRLMATPMRPYQFVTANIITRLLVAVAQAAIFLVVGSKMYSVPIHGAYWLVALCVVLGSLMFLGLGFTISGLARSMDAVPVLGNLVVLPMLFLGNVFFPASNLPGWLKPIASNLPLTFFADAMRRVISEGAGPVAIDKQLLGMTVWAVVLITAATLTFSFQSGEGAAT